MAKRKSKPVPPCRPVKGRPATIMKIIATNRLSARQRQSCANAAAELWLSFAWCESAEGHDFWKDVHDRLIALAEGAPLK